MPPAAHGHGAYERRPVLPTRRAQRGGVAGSGMIAVGHHAHAHTRMPARFAGARPRPRRRPGAGSARGWPQIGGPGRDFRVASAPLAESWPEGGPRRLWSRSLGEGYSALVTDCDLLVTMYRDGDSEAVIGMDAATGATRWEHRYDASLLHNGYVDIWLNASGPGPYATPLLAGGLIFTVGIDGRLHALDAATGAVRWSHDLVARFDLDTYNAFASSPLAVGQTVVLPLGGSGLGVAAFDQETGDVVWRSAPFAVAPGSPVPIEVDGQAQLVVVPPVPMICETTSLVRLM